MNVMSIRSLVVYSDAIGSGLGRVCSELCSALTSASVSVTFIAATQSFEPDVAQRDLVAPIGGAAYAGRLASILGKFRHFSEAAAAAWRNCGPERAFMMVHLSALVPFSMLPAWVARARGSEIILNLHDIYPHTSRFPRFLSSFERLLYRWCYRQFDFIVSMNDLQVRRLVDEIGISRDKIVTIRHGIFSYQGVTRPDSNESGIKFLVFGSLRPNKMIKETILAIKGLNAKGYDLSLRIAGAPRREDLDYWESCLSVIAVDKRIEVIDRFIDEGEVVTVLSGVDALICPYEAFDSQSGVAMLGLSNAIPLVATRAGAIENPERLGDAWQEVKSPVTIGEIEAAIVQFVAKGRGRTRVAADSAEILLQAEFGWSAAANVLRSLLEREGAQNVHQEGNQ